MVLGIRRRHFIRGNLKEIGINSGGAMQGFRDNHGAVQSVSKIRFREMKHVDVTLKCTRESSVL